MNQSNQDTLFQTTDLTLATVISLGQAILSVDKENPRRAVFFFKRTKRLDDLIKTYWDGKLKVEPQSFFNQLKLNKTRIYEIE